MQNNQMELENNYNRNLKLFKQHVPSIYEKLTSSSNDSYQLELFEKELNVSKNGLLLYPKGEVKEYFEELLLSYFKHDKQNIMNYNISATLEDKSIEKYGLETIHFKYQSQILINYANIFQKPPIHNNPQHTFVYSMIIFGVGLGYHIPELLNRYDIKHLILVDVDIEMLRVSLYTLNWMDILNYNNQESEKRSITIMIDEKSKPIQNQFGTFLSDSHPLAYFNMWQFVSYFDSELVNCIKGTLSFLDIFQGAERGFFDDEKWSLQHTLHNIKSKIPILTDSNVKVNKDKHLFIVANGPSLDKCIDIIKKYRDDVIIMAAGSALSSLYKYGIKPDFLIQIERHMYACEATLEYAPKEYLKDITLIAMNTVHPKMFSLFDKSYIFLKFLDTGTLFINKKQYYPELRNSYPSVSNGAFSLGLYLGFKKIFFFGMDFGYKSVDKHHSKNSMYYDKDSAFHDTIYSKQIEVEGVDGGIVYTESFYNQSRKSIEMLINQCLLDDEIQIYNYGQGALIKGTRSADHNSEYLNNIDNSISNKETLEAIDNQFMVYDKNIDIDKNIDEITKKIEKLKVFLEKNISNKMDVLDFVKLQDEFHSYYKEQFKEDKYMYTMLVGTIFLLISKIYVYISSHEHNENISFFINQSLLLMYNCLDDIKVDIQNLEKTVEIPVLEKKV